MTTDLSLRDRIADRSAQVCVVGLGHLGLPTALAYAQAGFRVVGVDHVVEKCIAVNEGTSPIAEVSEPALRNLVCEGWLRAVASLGKAGDVDIIDICVPTPLNRRREPDISAIRAVIRALRQHLRRGQLVMLTSTSYPGTLVEVVRPELEATGLRAGRDFFVAYSPARLDPGNTRYGLRNTPRLVSGVTPSCAVVAAELLATTVDTVVPVSSPAIAEMAKLFENTFRSVNIALANELAVMCHHLGIDVWEVIEGASTKPYGFMPFSPGPGLGGHCIPIDPIYLSWKLQQMNYSARFVDLADDVNRRMPLYVIGRIRELLSQEAKSLEGSQILLLGLTYKRDIGDIRESPAVEVFRLLHENHARVSFADPYVEVLRLGEADAFMGVTLTRELLSQQDLVVVTTDHSMFDWSLVRASARMVFDTRGPSRRGSHSRWHVL